MRVQMRWSSLAETKWHEYLLRFVFGGVVTALTGWIANRFGPVIGGLFLAFPAIFPATATLIEKHEKQKKQRAGMEVAVRGRLAAGADAAGSAVGSLALIAFAVVVWRWLPGHGGALVIGTAAVAWVVAAGAFWWVWKE